MRADFARSTFGLTGTGVIVGVLSNSFNCLGGGAADMANGDLSPVTVIQEISSCTGANDEGRAMLQIVHDVAPGTVFLSPQRSADRRHSPRTFSPLRRRGRKSSWTT